MPCAFLFWFIEKRTMASGGFPGFNPAILSKRESSFKLKQNLEKKKSDVVKNGSKENTNGETEKQMQMSEKDNPGSEVPCLTSEEK